MKKHTFYTLLIALLGILPFTACSDDDNYPTEKELTGHFIGSFEGTVSIDSILQVPIGQGTDMMPEGAIYKKTTEKATSNGLMLDVTPIDGKHINLALQDVYYQGHSWNFDIPNIEVGRLYDTYTLNGTATFNLEPFGECSMSIIGSANATALGCTVRLTAPGCSAATGNVGDTGFSGLTFTFISTKATGSESSEARIETFELPTSVGANKDAELEGGTIDQTNHRIAFTCKAGAKLNKLKPTITISPEKTATVYPASESEVDFSSGQYIFSVVAEDGTKVNYTVTVTPREEEESTES